MANEDKPRGRPGKPAAGGRDRAKGARQQGPGGKDGGGLRSRGFKDTPGGGKPGGKSRGFRDRPEGGAGGDKPRPFRDRSSGPGGDRPFRDRPGGDRRTPRERPERDGPERTVPREQQAAAVETDTAARAEPERIAKYLARAGVASRRDAERMIEMGRVTLNGAKLESPAINVTPSDVILVDGQPIPEIERTRLWLYHKPAGLVTTNRDPEGRPTVFEKLPKDLPRVLSVGRLDINTEGLLLLTNDGGLARMLELPQTGWLRRYRVRAHGKVEQKRLDELKNGIVVDGVFYGAVEAEIEREQGANIWLTVGLREGKNREVKNILGALGLDVNRLIRISFGPFQLGELPEGAVLEIKGKTLRDQLGDRLIEEAGANFDAPVRKAFSNKPVRAEEGETRLVQVKKSGDWVSASPVRQETGKGGERKRFDRDDALSRLDTRKPERGDSKPGKRAGPSAGGDTDKQRHGRSSNVWMAPGARPQGKKPKPRPEGGKPGQKRGPRPGGPKRKG
ncbi:pseudouridine synthase [Oricola nitratireducens]|uniref:pseudouridine synthase n=1 Tax=Oricola nitratireducens TaxID=2775868 RepID=UPI0018688CBF|nr:pseudouridine synthase [Oricola nitratireducens]